MPVDFDRVLMREGIEVLLENGKFEPLGDLAWDITDFVEESMQKAETQ